MATTPLDQRREENANPDRAGALRRVLEEQGVEAIYYQFTTLNGRVMAKTVPARHLERNLVKGVQFHSSALADLASDRHGEMIGYGAEEPEFVAIPDLETFAILPWDPACARFTCDLYTRRDLGDNPGQPHPADVRGALRRADAAFRERHGLVLRAGCEPEMTWLGDSIAIKHPPQISPAYGIGALETVRPVVERVVRYAQALGLDMIEGDYEDGGQVELNFAFDEALRTADRLVTYRLICKQVARELGLTATFMPKPFHGVMANACHHNLSLWHGDVNTFVEPGRSDLHLTPTARHALGGLLAHARGMMAVWAPTVNSYARFWESALFAPNLANWGYDNRTCAVRVSAAGRLELKLPDASVNPYLSMACALAAMDDGLQRQLDPGDAFAASSYDEKLAARYPQLPRTLGEALQALREDAVACAALGPELLRIFEAYKRDEWERFCGAVTEWHREMYLDGIP